MRHSSRAWVRADMFKTTPGEAHRGSLPEKAPFLFNFHHVCSEPVLAIDRILSETRTNQAHVFRTSVALS
eukprot:COSAG06_NODE_3520_length_5232_cov_6.600429_6_plen_70_part_00